jgi:hypothetical protein
MTALTLEHLPTPHSTEAGEAVIAPAKPWRDARLGPGGRRRLLA